MKNKQVKQMIESVMGGVFIVECGLWPAFHIFGDELSGKKTKRYFYQPISLTANEMK